MIQGVIQKLSRRAPIGRKPKMKLHRANVMLGDRQEEISLLVEVYGMTWEQAVEHRKLSHSGTIYVTQHACEPCEYQVVVTRGINVPQQGEFNAEVVQIAIKRMDGKMDTFNWEDMQDIKRVLLGDDVEAVEIYPAFKRRLLGNRKFRYLWAFPNKEQIPIGWDQDDPERNQRG